MEKSPYSQKEEEVLKFWAVNSVFEKSISERPEDKPYVFYDGPPFATGLPHYGHILASTVKDVYPRFYTMKGKRVERRWGWDCHGLPIENIAEKELGIKTKKQIEEFGVEEFNEFCRSKVMSYAEDWKTVINRLGRWADMEHPYKTMDLDYMESVWWVFKQLWDNGLIYEGYRSMHICPRCETTLSQSEVAEGYKDVKDLSVIAKFELKDEPETFLLAWTTTPWTLLGNVALAVGKDITYVKITFSEGEDSGRSFIISEDTWGRELFKGKKIDKARIKIEKIKGQDLVGKKYVPLLDFQYKNWQSDTERLGGNFNDLIGDGWKVVSADFVTTDDGTGIVHIAPAFGEADLELLCKLKNKDDIHLPFIQHIGMDGIIKPGYGEFSGLSVKPIDDVQSTDVAIIKYLAEKDLLFNKAQYEHSYPHCWRCDTPLINYATSSWFVAVEKIKDEAIDLARSIHWSPTHVKEGRFGMWLSGARDWSISRQRYWASVIPIWKCEKCDEIKVFGSVSELEEISGEEIHDLHKHVVDKIEFNCVSCNGKMKRIPDVLDTWFDSGSMPYAQNHYPFENKQKFEDNFPAEFIGEGIDQTRAWFYYLHILSTAIMQKTAYKNVVVNGIVLAEDGKKMSKRLNNYPDPMSIFDQYGADALRFYLMNSVVMQADNLFFNEKDLREIYNKVINTTSNILSFYKIYENDFSSDDFDLANLSVLDQYVLSRTESVKAAVTKHLEGYDSVRATREIRSLIDDISLWWLRRSRERFRDQSTEAKNAFAVLRYVIKNLALMLAPITPYISEELYQAIKNEDEPISVHLMSWPEVNKEYISPSIEKDMLNARSIVEMGHSVRSRCAIKVRQPISSIWWNAKFENSAEEITKIILAELNIEKFGNKKEFKTTESNTEGGLEIAIDVELDARLRGLGDLRELIRAIQDKRKKMGLKPKDKIALHIETEGLDQFIKANIEKISDDTNLSAVEPLVDRQDSTTVELGLGKAYFKLGD
jgi:isoleucyl-tRNA synthetase